ncbi:hypothetical protein F5Y14DRAFT_100569 [Nemania sp. NC0429]|nr:hypothetical protein F5Y14DRAFT_100569 [Nemania sp. NC0429]
MGSATLQTESGEYLISICPRAPNFSPSLLFLPKHQQTYAYSTSSNNITNCPQSPSPSSLPASPTTTTITTTNCTFIHSQPPPPDNQTTLRLLLASRPTMSGTRQAPFPQPAYKLHEFGDHDVAVAAEEGRPASSGRSRMAEPGGRELRWIKATFVAAVVLTTLVVVGFALVFYLLIRG